jgi:ribosomal protein L24
MTHFQVGDQVIIRYGGHQGQKGKIIKSQQADVFEVRIQDGSVLFFSGKGLDKESEDSNRAHGRMEMGNPLAQKQTTSFGKASHVTR